MKVFLGIDTSSYTTSMCLLGEDGKIKADERIILHVASGSQVCGNRKPYFNMCRIFLK